MSPNEPQLYTTLLNTVKVQGSMHFSALMVYSLANDMNLANRGEKSQENMTKIKIET
jgi:hypothetical protein